jgi:hypothetical protein
MHKGKIATIVAAACLAAAMAVGLSAYAPMDSTLTPQEMSRALATLHVRLADAHSDACKANLDQCTKNCAGATSCTNQCQTNYNGCMGNGG